MQKARDEAAGLNTAGYVTGYRGSPLGGLDQQFERAKRFLEPQHIVFQRRPQRGSGGHRAVGHPAGRDAGRGRL